MAERLIFPTPKLTHPMKPTLFTLIAASSLMLAHGGEVSAPAITEPTTTNDSEWQITNAMYVPMMGISGDVALGPIKGSPNIGFDDLLEDLDGAFSTALEFKKGPWFVNADLIWLKVSSLEELPGDATLKVRQQQFYSNLSLGHSIYQTETTQVDAFAGAALNSLDLDLRLRALSTERSRSGSETWVDPFVGARVRHSLGNNWNVWARGEYGGFGVASDSYWQAIIGVSYDLTKQTSLALAYRWIANDYTSGNFKYDMQMSGPNIGLIVKF